MKIDWWVNTPLSLLVVDARRDLPARIGPAGWMIENSRHHPATLQRKLEGKVGGQILGDRLFCKLGLKSQGRRQGEKTAREAAKNHRKYRIQLIALEHAQQRHSDSLYSLATAHFCKAAPAVLGAGLAYSPDHLVQDCENGKHIGSNSDSSSKNGGSSSFSNAVSAPAVPRT